MVVILFLLLSKVSVAQTICQEPNIDIAMKKSDGLADKEFLKDFKSHQIVIAGEHHHEFTKLDAKLDVIRTFAKEKGKGACLALEYPAGKAGFKKVLGKMTEIIERLKSSPDMKEEKGYDWLLETMEKLYAGFSPLSELAFSLGMNVKGVDHKEQLKSDASTDDRNNAMAENMKGLIDSKECSSILFFVGKGHLGLKNHSSTRVQDLTRKNGMSVVTINLQMTKETVFDALKSWSVCSPAKKEISQYIVFKNSILKGNSKFYLNDSTEKMTWKDFDYTLLIP